MALRVYINGRRDETEGPISVTDLLASKKIRPEVCTVAVNRAVLPREEYAATTVGDTDEVEIMLQMAGGAGVDWRSDDR